MSRAPKLTHWVDTSVHVDFDTTISMSKNMRYGEKSILETRRAMQRAAWLAMACDQVCAVSVTFGHEHGRKLDVEAAPETVAGHWTHMMAHIVRPYACPRWRVRHTSEGALVSTPDGPRPASNDERDDFMIAASKRNDLILITSDGPAYKKAKRSGANAYLPAEYAAQVISFEVAHERFMERLDRGIRAFLERHPNGRHSWDNANVIWECYEGIWDEDLR